MINLLEIKIFKFGHLVSISLVAHNLSQRVVGLVHQLQVLFHTLEHVVTFTRC